MTRQHHSPRSDLTQVLLFLTVLASTLLTGTAMTTASRAADYPTPKTGVWTARDFRFHSGEVLPEVRLGYTTIGDPKGEPVLVLHGTGGAGAMLLTPQFSGELFGPGQPLDAAKYFIILPDALGAGKSSKPSDALKSKFPKFNYDDHVQAHYRLVSEGLNIPHLRLVIGNSMGGMHTWAWGVKYPDFMDALVPMAALPTAMSARNWMLRRLLIETVRRDPDFRDGNYTTQPKSMALANVFYAVATNGGSQAYHAQAPTRELADKLVDERLAAPFAADANDFLGMWESARDYNPAPELSRITASLLAINAVDDERNPVELGLLEREITRIKGARYHLVPASSETRGHGTTGMAKFWKEELRTFLMTVPKRGA